MSAAYALRWRSLCRTLVSLLIATVLVSCDLMAQSTKTGPQTAPQTPQSEEERFKRLMESPDDQELWGAELKKQQDEGLALEERRVGPSVLSQGKIPVSNAPDLLLEIASNHERQGIALRHLKRYPEALSQFSEAQIVVDGVKNDQHCSVRTSTEICLAVREQYHMINSYKAYVYADSKDFTTAKQHSDLALQFAADSDEYCSYVFSMVRMYSSRNQYDPAAEIALTAAEKALASGQKQEVDCSFEILIRLYRDTLWRSISWVPETSKLRRKDPQGFADSHGIGVGRPYRYGMTNPEEDKATFVALIATDSSIKEAAKTDPESRKLQNDPNRDIEGYVRSQLATNTFEFVAKYVFFKYVTTPFHFDGPKLRCQKQDKSAVPLSEIMSKLAAAPRSQVDENTRQILELFFRANQRLTVMCSRPAGETPARGTGSLHPVAIEAAAEATKLSELSM